MVWDYSKGEHTEVLFILHCIGTTLSILGTSWVVFYCIKSKAYRRVHLRLVFALTLSDFFYAVANVLAIFDPPAPKVNVNCTADAFIRVCSFTMIQLFATALTVLCYLKVKYGRAFNQSAFFNRTCIFGFVMCAWMTMTPLFLDSTHYANGNLCCDVIVEKPHNAWDFILTVINGAIPIIIMLLISLVAYVLTIRVFRSYPRELVQENSQIYKLFWYPAVMFLMFLPGLNDIYSINFFIITEKSSFVLELLHLIMTRNSGVINALVFGVQMKSYYLAERDRSRTLSEGLVNGESHISTGRRDSIQIKAQEALLT